MNKKAFTFMELIIVMVIIAIIGTVGFVSYTEFIGDARDSQRASDLGKIGSSLKIFKQKRGYYASPGDSFNITNSGHLVATQGQMNKNVRLQTLSTIPLDPKIHLPYTYSVSGNKQSFQLAATLENEQDPIALVEGDYNSVSKHVLPTLLLALSGSGSVEIHDLVGSGSENRKKFIFSYLGDNIPYNLETSLPISTATSFDDLLLEAETDGDFWQNNDYRNCVEIKEASKTISDFTNTGATEQYQVLTNSGELVNTLCNDNTDIYNTP